MTIHELLALTGLTANDEIPVWDAEASGEPTKKITAQNFAAAIKTLASLLGTGDVVNDLTSTATDKPLSAAQGKALKEAIATGGANYLQLPSGTYICWGSDTITAGSDRVNISFSAFAQPPIIVVSANNAGTFRVNNIATYYATIACNEGNVSSDRTIYWAAFGTK